MKVRDFEDLVCWQLAYALKCEVIDFTATEPASRDFKYRDQIRQSSSSQPCNVAEGFGRYRIRDAARFCDYALESLDVQRNLLVDGRDRAYLTPALFSRLSNLARAALRATRNWMLYLKRRPDAMRDEPRARPDAP